MNSKLQMDEGREYLDQLSKYKTVKTTPAQWIP
jgi:hypothetical protein